VISIGATAFFGCSGLVSVTIPASITNIGYQAFGGCSSLKSVYFQGNAVPNTDPFSYLVIIGYNFGKPIYGLALDNTTVYYGPGATGWNSTFGGEPTVLWNAQAHVTGIVAGRFTFGITGPSNAVVVVEACVDLSAPNWVPVKTNTLSISGTSVFSDPQTANFSNQYYRFRLR
jgi:hypothetical protein